jgi:hypothetical protein
MIPIRLKRGVRLRGMCPQILLVPQIAVSIWEKYGAPELWITSGTDGRHSRGSYHHAGTAVDLRSRNLPPENIGFVVDALRGALGDDFDVVRETTHIHVEYEG